MNSGDFGPGEIAWLFIHEAIGGVAYGLLIGYLGYLLIKSVQDDPKIEILITIAIVAGGYSLASIIHVSGPLAMVAAGLFLGHKLHTMEFSPTSKSQLTLFWETLDEILNTLLFVLIGLEILIIPFQLDYLMVGLLTVAIVLMGRLISVAISSALVRSKLEESYRDTVTVMTWGGLRGGISIALVLSLPETPDRDFLIFITYSVVIFSIVVQGLTLGKLVKRLNLS